MTCGECRPEDCIAHEGWGCKRQGDFFTTGEWANLREYFNIHGVSFNQKIDSVKQLLDLNTILILKVLICDSNRWDYPTSMEIMFLLDEIISKLSTDNKENIVFNNSETIQGSDDNV